jgi:hypothetical protein
MLDNSLIEESSTESLLSDFISDRIETENFHVKKNLKNGHWYLKNTKENYYNILSIDSNSMIKQFAKSLIGRTFESILISGLGLGIIPFLCQNTTDIVDVVEVEKEVIDIVKQIGHLDSNVRIYHQNIWDFIPEMKYDIILFDHWMSYATEDEMSSLKEKFNPYLNPNGIITIPIHEQMSR